jgi:hypothetical protein
MDEVFGTHRLASFLTSTPTHRSRDAARCGIPCGAAGMTVLLTERDVAGWWPVKAAGQLGGRD